MLEGLLKELEGITLDYILVRGREARYLTFCFRDRILVHLLHHPQDVRGLAVVLPFVLHEVNSVGRGAGDRRAGGGWSRQVRERRERKGDWVSGASCTKTQSGTREREKKMTSLDFKKGHSHTQSHVTPPRDRRGCKKKSG